VDDALRELLDRQTIADLVHDYCLHYDGNRPEAVAALFTADAEVDYGPEMPTIHGAADLQATIAVGLRERFSATSHHVSNLRIDFDGPDRADGTAYLYAWHAYRDGSPDGELWGRYRHRFVRTTDGWRIAGLLLQAAGARHFHRSVMHPVERE